MLSSPEILVPVDFSPCSINALRVALGLASPDGDLTLLHVIDEHFVEDAVGASLGTTEEIRERLRKQAEANFDATLADIDAGQVDVERMIVVGSHGRTGVSHLLTGSVAEKVVRHAPCPILVVPPVDEEAPRARPNEDTGEELPTGLSAMQPA